MNRATLTFGIFDNGDLLEKVQVPANWCVCPVCQGAYDQRCKRCFGSGKILRPDWSRCNAKQLATVLAAEKNKGTQR